MQLLKNNRRFSRQARSLVLALASIYALSACSTLSLSPARSGEGDGSSLGPGGTSPSGDLSDSGSDLEAIPLEVNKNVLQWIDYFQGRGRPHMERYLQRSTRYMPTMKKILKENGLPEDLIYIALIESGFSSTAHSSANAVGYWQFIRSTGKHYNLRIDSYVDDRRDFVKSTQAAAEYFKGLYNLFGAWYLAIASYNVGENRVKGLVMRNHTRDFWKLARENRLPDETVNYVPKFLAARLIAKDPEKYGFVDLEYMPPLEFSEVEFETSLDIRKLAQEMKIEYDDLRDLNPAWKRGVAFTDRTGKLTLRVPVGLEAQAVAAAPTAVAGNIKTYVADEDFGYYRVRRGDTLSTIARKFGTSQSTIRSLNNFGRGSRLVAGKRIRVPAEQVADRGANNNSKKSATEKKSSVTAAKAPSPKRELARQAPSQPKSKVHVVRRGESLTQIARRYQVSIRELANHNKLNHRAKVSTGARLSIP